MYDPTKPGYHTHNQTRIFPNYEPTLPDNPYSYSPYDLQTIPPPPPKPPHVQNTVAFALAVALVVLLAVMSGLVFELVNMSNKLAVHVPTPVPTGVKGTSRLSSPTQVPTNQTQTSSGYTAQDLLHDFINAGADAPSSPPYNVTIWDWSGHAFSVKEHALSSVIFGDAEGCTGPCTPGQVGLWVYSSPDIAIHVQDEVIQDEANGNIAMFGYITPYVSGRCLLLTNVTDPIYKQVVQEHCN